MSLLKVGRPTQRKKEKSLASAQGEQEEFMRMNINISKSFHKQIKQYALDRDTTVTEIVIKALKGYMSK